MKTKNILSYISIIIFAILLAPCARAQKTVTYSNSINNYIYPSGRTDRMPNGNFILVGSASSVLIPFTGNRFTFHLKSLNPNGKSLFVTLVLNGKDLGRKKVDDTVTNFTVVGKNGKSNSLEIYKSAEAGNGGIEVIIPHNAKVLKAKWREPKKIKIEFIGNSITCGFGADVSIPCGSGEWFDQSSAYWAYGPQLARMLNVDFMLSSVSGIGMYRNWNDEHQAEPIMPDVYENLYLNRDSTKKYDFSFHPDIISICLGSNDLSDGDGKKPRLPFNAEKYIFNYVAFVKMLYRHYPNTQIVLLNSPMIMGAKKVTMDSCLQVVKTAFANDTQHKPILIFHFSDKIVPHGCGNHPDIQNHTQMANEMYPFFKKIIEN